MSWRTRAPGKLILLGEYAVLRGAPALVTAVDRYARVDFRPADQIRLTAPDIQAHAVPLTLTAQGQVRFLQPQPPQRVQQTAFVHAALEAAFLELQQVGTPFPPLDIHISTREFFTPGGEKLGLGSSAAVTVALLAGLLKDRFPAPQTWPAFQETLLLTAFQAHRRAQGHRGSGVDIAASILGGTLVYRMPPVPDTLPAEMTHLPLPADLKLLFVWTGRSASTTHMLQRIEAFRRRAPREHRTLFAELVALAEAGAAAFLRRDTPEFLRVVELYFQMFVKLTEKSQAPIISDVHRDIADRVRREGMVYKPSGAGGGDFGIVFSNDEAEIERVGKNLSRAGYTIVPLTVNAEGVTIMSS